LNIRQGRFLSPDIGEENEKLLETMRQSGRRSIIIIAILGITFMTGGCKKSQGLTANLPSYNSVSDLGLLTPSSTAIFEKVIANGSKFALCNGEDVRGPLVDSTYIFDTTTLQWTGFLMTNDHSQGGYATAGSKMLFAGGSDPNETPYGATSAIDIYDVISGQWATATLSEPRFLLSATSLGNIAAFAGGTGTMGVSANVDLYDASTGQWSTALLSAARIGIAAASAGTKMVFAGGTGALQNTDAVDIYDIVSKNWSVAKLNTPRSNCLTAAVGDEIVFIGGNGNFSNATGVDIYNSSTGVWKTDSVPSGRDFYCAVAAGDLVLLPSVSDTLSIYKPSTGQWSYELIVGGRYFFAGASLGTLAMFSGNSTIGPVTEYFRVH
jgi:hypothetical protein